jgi:PAS domain-containing protein
MLETDVVVASILNAVRHLYEPVLVLDLEWRYIYVNDQATKYLRRSRDDIIGRPVFEIATTLAGSRFEVMFREAMADQQTRQVIEHHIAQDRWYTVGIHPTPTALLLHVRDITDEHRAQMLNDRLLKSLEERLEHQKRRAL